VHPRGGTAHDGVHLCVYDGYDGARTGIGMVVHEGRTYLKHNPSNPNDNFYVHPEGGSSSPGNETRLVYFSTYRPGISITIRPAEDCIVESVEIDSNALNGLQSDPIIATTTISNPSDTAFQTTATVAYNRSLQNTYSYSFTEAFGIKITNTVSAGVKDVASDSTTIEFTFNFSATQTTTTSTTEGVTSTVAVQVTVPPQKAVQVNVTTKRLSGSLPYTAHCINQEGMRFTLKGILHTEYFFQQTVSQKNIPL